MRDPMKRKRVEGEKSRKKTKEIAIFKFLLNIYNKNCDYFLGRKA